MFNREVIAPSAATAAGAVAFAALVYAAEYLSMSATTAERQLLQDIVTGGSRRLKQLSPGLSRFE